MQKYEKKRNLIFFLYFCILKMKEGLVIRTTGSWYRVMVIGYGLWVMDDCAGQPRQPSITNNLSPITFFDCRLRGNYRLRGNKQTNPVAVGDHVFFEVQDDGTGVIHDVADRKNYIVRRATKLSKQTHVIAANIDLLCIVATLGLPRTSTGFIDRLLVTAEAYHIPACILFNKVDLYDDELWEIHNEIKGIYTAAGYPVYEVSALEGIGLDEVKQLIAGKTVLFSGHSGVGKSALLNALAPGLDLKVGDISDWSLKGRHTTTFAEIHPIRVRGYGLEVIDANAEQPRQPSITHNLSPITYLIDTPGIKEFGMVNFNAQELSHFFPEMRALIPNCHFANCTHRHEPGCAVKEALDEGLLSTERYKNYLGILEDVDDYQRP